MIRTEQDIVNIIMRHLFYLGLVALLASSRALEADEEAPLASYPYQPSLFDLYGEPLHNIHTRSGPSSELAENQGLQDSPKGNRGPWHYYMNKKNDELSRLAMRILKRSRGWESQAFSKPIINFARYYYLPLNTKSAKLSKMA